jgi:hypothetical protein
MTKDEIIIGMMALIEGFLNCGAALSEEEEEYDRLVGEYEKVCVKEEM